MDTRTLCLLGPTAVGKSALALMLAQRFEAQGGAEIVSIDSAQVYDGMDIGTAKPTALERAQVPHHLIDLISPEASYSAGQFRRDALDVIAKIHTRGRVALLVGGTMLYYRALLEGLDDLPQADAALRTRIDTQAQLAGWPAMHAELARIDPSSAQRLSPQDGQRIQRALEVYYASGRPLSAWQQRTGSPLPFDMTTVALLPTERSALHARIAARFSAMLDRGLVDELRALRTRYKLHADLPSMRAVGYRQAWQFLDQEIDATQLREQAEAATRQLAKRQLTWLRSFTNVHQVHVDLTNTNALPALSAQILNLCAW
jgi:tRNA dimethylallyltransferase